MTQRLNIEGLRYAQAVAATGSFSAAARIYGVTQPALSNGIARLENRLGAQLFERSPRGVTVTDFGTRILAQIDRALTELDAITAEANRLTEADRASIHLGISPLINPLLVARAYSAVAELPNPRDLVLREADMTQLQHGLLAGTLDAILIPSVEPLPYFEHHIIDAEPVVIVESQPTGTQPVDFRDTADQPFILVPDSCGLTTFTTQLFDAHQLTMNTYPGEAASYQVLEQWANLGLGTAILPRSKLSSPEARHRLLRDEDIDVEIFYEAVWHRGSRLAGDVANLAQRLGQRTGA